MLCDSSTGPSVSTHNASQGVDNLYDDPGEGSSAEITNRIRMARRLFRKAVQQGRSKRRGEIVLPAVR